MDNYEKRVRAYEKEGICRSDAQAIVDAEDMQKVKHTPLEQLNILGFSIKRDMNHATAKINAAFIVKAVNNHEALVEALGLAEATIKRLANNEARLNSVQGTLQVINQTLKNMEG